MAFTPIELEKGGVRRIADDADEEAHLRWDGWLPTGTPVSVSTFDDKVRDLVADKTSVTAVELRAALVTRNPVIASVVLDGEGNWTSWTEDGVAHSATYDPATGNIATLTVAGVTRTFTFDTNDNLVGAA